MPMRICLGNTTVGDCLDYITLIDGIEEGGTTYWG